MIRFKLVINIRGKEVVLSVKIVYTIDNVTTKMLTYMGGGGRYGCDFILECA